MKLKVKFTTLEVGGVICAVPVGNENNFHGMIKMNETTENIIKLLENDIGYDEIVSKLLEIYDTDKETIESSVGKILDALRDSNLIEG